MIVPKSDSPEHDGTPALRDAGFAPASVVVGSQGDRVKVETPRACTPAGLPLYITETLVTVTLGDANLDTSPGAVTS